MTAARKQFRTDLKDELGPLMTSLQSEDDFYRYEPANYNHRSPVVFLRSSGAEHTYQTPNLKSDFLVQVHLLVLYADLTNSIYYEETSTDLLDDLEQELSAAVESKRRVANKWQDLSFEGRSDAQPEPIGGELWLHEIITLRGRLY